jgi:hypothetical protein
MTVDEFSTTYPRLAITKLPVGYLRSLLDGAAHDGSLEQFMSEMAKLNAGYGIHPPTQFAGVILLASPTEPRTLVCMSVDRSGASLGNPVTIVYEPDGWTRLGR